MLSWTCFAGRTCTRTWRRCRVRSAGALDRVTRPFGLAEYPATSPVRRKTEDLVFWVIVGGLLAWGAVARLTYLRRSIGFGAFGACIGLGAITFARVIVVVSALVWVPIGATIG